MIYTLTLNPAIDYTLRLDRLEPGETNRSRAESFQPGGKGLNVSAVLASLGVKSVALGFIAGKTGELLEEAVRARGIETDFIRLSQRSMTRINVKILEEEKETEINAKGPEIGEKELHRLFEKLRTVRDGDTLVLSGSLPGSLPADLYAEILSRLAGTQIRVAADTAGDALRSILPFRPFLIKPNLPELAEVSGRAALKTDGEIAGAARALQRQGAQRVLVSLGGEGALFLDVGGAVYRIPALPGKVVNTVGAGDSMLAGFLAGIGRGTVFALRLGTAAGCATAFSPGLAGREEILALFPDLA